MGKDLVQQPAQPARRGGGAGRDRGLRRAESPFGRAGLSRELPSLGHPRCPDLGPSAQCHSGGCRWGHQLYSRQGCKRPWLQAQAPRGWAGDAKSPGTAPMQASISLTTSNHGWHQPGGSGTPKGQPFCCPSADARLNSTASFPCSERGVGRGAKCTAVSLSFVCQANILKHSVSGSSMLGGQVQAAAPSSS